jgi:hypothetical protein
MQVWKRLALAGLALTASGCVTRDFHENAALRAALPSPPAAEISSYVVPQDDFPTVAGDILRGTSPADLAAAREEAVRPLAADPGAARQPPN